MSEALENIVDLFATRSTARTTKQRLNGLRYARNGREKGAGKASATATSMAWLDEAKRPKPSLPRVKWLERPDP